jgi:hypothetical protein
MFKLLVFLTTFSLYASANDCNTLYDNRGEDLDTTVLAYSCFEDLNKSNISKLKKSSNLNKMSYLKFFQASFFENDSINSLATSFTLAKDSIKLYAPLFNRVDVLALPSSQVDQVALSYYLYGTAVSKYVDLKGKWEAIKRKSEIKNTMKMILGLKKPSTFHFGAYRTLAIFNLKVPKIAGGDLKKSGMFFKKLFKDSMTEINVISYPVGHIFYSEYLFKIGKKNDACKELDLVKSLTDQEIDRYFQDLKFETTQDRAVAHRKFELYSC